VTPESSSNPSETEAAAPPTHSRWRLVRCLLRWGEHALALIGALVLLYCLGFDASVVISKSMSPTLQGDSFETGDWVLTEKVSYWFREPRRWEVVTFRQKDGTQVMKRVGGLPGEVVSLDDGKLVIDTRAQSFPESLDSLHYYSFAALYKGRSVTCEPEHYFVFGDYSRDSMDSRYEGTVPKDRIRGRAWLRIWPPNRFGRVNLP
jgi:signal peptidase I